MIGAGAAEAESSSESFLLIGGVGDGPPSPFSLPPLLLPSVIIITK